MRFSGGLTALALLGAAAGPACDVRPIDIRWQDRLAEFERADRESPPGPGAVLFVGSSSVSGWDLGSAFPDVPVINRGLPGATIRDVLRHADRTVEPYAPGVVVLYGGENDIAKGADPDEVLDAVLDLLALVRARDPSVTVLVLAVKPSPRRWSLRERIARTNALLRDRARVEPGLEFVDVASPLLDEDGRPRPDQFQPDGLHLSERGYRTWTTIVAPRVVEALARRGERAPAGRHALERAR